MDIVVVDKINVWAIESGDFIRLPDGSEVIVKRIEDSTVLDNHYAVIYMNDFGDDEESFTLDQDDMVELLQYA